jgi:hypothetical protein
MNAERVTIESDEAGFELHVMDENGDWHIWNIHGIAEDVYDTVKREIGPWLYERDQARSDMIRRVPEYAAWENSFRCDDPERDWVEDQRHAADLANKARKENQP